MQYNYVCANVLLIRILCRVVLCILTLCVIFNLSIFVYINVVFVLYLERERFFWVTNTLIPNQKLSHLQALRMTRLENMCMCSVQCWCSHIAVSEVFNCAYLVVKSVNSLACIAWYCDTWFSETYICKYSTNRFLLAITSTLFHYWYVSACCDYEPVSVWPDWRQIAIGVVIEPLNVCLRTVA